MTKNKYELEVLKKIGKLNPMLPVNYCIVKLYDEDEELLNDLSSNILSVSFNNSKGINNEIYVNLTINESIFNYLMLKSLKNEDLNLSKMYIEEFVESQIYNSKGTATGKIKKCIANSILFKVEDIVENSITVKNKNVPEQIYETNRLELILKCSIIEEK